MKQTQVTKNYLQNSWMEATNVLINKGCALLFQLTTNLASARNQDDFIDILSTIATSMAQTSKVLGTISSSSMIVHIQYLAQQS